MAEARDFDVVIAGADIAGITPCRHAVAAPIPVPWLAVLRPIENRLLAAFRQCQPPNISSRL